MRWETFLGFVFIIFASVVLYGAAQGWFSRKVPASKLLKGGDVNVTVRGGLGASSDCDCDALRKLIARLQGKIFELETALATCQAQNAEMRRELQDLMSAINELTTELQNALANLALINKKYKEALEELAECRRQLAECRAKLLARQITDETCHMQPENNNLLR
jgi:septal ring factor EnvC (AmiA/AmiB activator)